MCWPWEVVDDDEWIADPHDVPADGVLTPEGYRQLQDYRRIPNINGFYLACVCLQGKVSGRRLGYERLSGMTTMPMREN